MKRRVLVLLRRTDLVSGLGLALPSGAGAYQPMAAEAGVPILLSQASPLPSRCPGLTMIRLSTSDDQATVRRRAAANLRWFVCHPGPA